MYSSKKCSDICVCNINKYNSNNIKYMKSTNIVLVVAVTMLSISLITKPKVDNSEVINTVEDMIYWISEDVESGYLDSTRADSYIDNLEQMIKELE